MTSNLPPLAPLSETEVATLSQQLLDSGGSTLDYARGVFSAAACGPTPVEPTSWLPWLLGPSAPNKAALRQLIELLVRDAQSIAECLGLGEPWLPASPEAMTQFCKGFTRGTQSDAAWQKASEVFVKVLPIAVTAGYLDLTSVQRFLPAATDAQTWLDGEHEQLPARLVEIHRHFAASRAAHRPNRVEKVGRNEPCPCGSGKKHKKCCAH